MRTLKLVGKKIHLLTVLSEAPRKKGRSRFRCQCDCGNFTEVDGSKLNTGVVHSCGCYIGKQLKPGNRKGFGESVKNAIIHVYRYNAKRRNVAFELTEEEAVHLFQSPCYFCGREPFKKVTKKRSYGHYVCNGIDRLDNTKGYVPTNCVSCCEDCNYMKKAYRLEDFLSLVGMIYRNRLDIPA